MNARAASAAGASPFSLAGKRVWVAGHRGMVGSALVRRVAREGCDVMVADRRDVDLREQAAVRGWMSAERPDVVLMAAAKVGGILANSSYPADFLYDNLIIQSNVLESAYQTGVHKLLFLGSSCIYPKMAPQPIPESALLTGPLEPTNEWYAVAKIAGIKLAQAYRRQHGCDFISAMPTNLYGPGDNFDLQTSHVVPALMHKVHLAKVGREEQVTIWGSGRPFREFLHVDDLADACIHLLKNYSAEQHVNVGTGEDISIAELAEMIASTVGWEGKFVYDADKPDGTPRKRLDVSLLSSLGWKASIPLDAGLKSTYEWFLQNATPRSTTAVGR